MRTIPTLLCALALTFASASLEAAAIPFIADEGTVQAAPQSALKDTRVRLFISPNPLVTRSTLEAGGAIIQRVSIHDLHGRAIRVHQNINDIRFVIERGDLQPGTYVVRVLSDRGPGSIKLAVE